MALILSIETATDVCSVGLARDGLPICRKDTEGSFQHASQVTLLIHACAEVAGIRLQELDAVAVSAGPGSYTGLRVGTSTAKGICYALDKPLIAVDTLQSMANACRLAHPTAAFFIPMIDARRMEIYTAVFDTQAQPLTPTEAKVMDETAFADWAAHGKPILYCGDGAEKCQELLADAPFQFVSLDCSADHLAPLAEIAYREGRFADVAYFSPFYLKPPNITKSRKNVLG